MARLYRLLSPGIVFATLGIVVFSVSKLSWFQVRGGLMTIGLYALAIQIVLSALLIAAIDDLSGSGLWHRVGRGTGKLGISARPISFSRGLVEFYQRPFWPACLAGFGLGASLSVLIVGSFHETGTTPDFAFQSLGIFRSEAVLGLILIFVAALLWWRGGRSYFGWVIGMVLATVIGQMVFVPKTDAGATIAGWGGLMIGLCLARLLVLGMAHVRRTGFSLRFPAQR
jgi:hypothetical protein